MRTFSTLKDQVALYEDQIAELKRRIEMHIEEMIVVLDSNATFNHANEEGGGLPEDEEESRPKSFIIAKDTIIRCSNLQQEELIDEALKARFLARIFREYRRNLEHAKRV